MNASPRTQSGSSRMSGAEDLPVNTPAQTVRGSPLRSSASMTSVRSSGWTEKTRPLCDEPSNVYGSNRGRVH